jgi:mRNA-degrading endonuclease toxin of MazEF toxin-antitoxin module
MTTYECGEVVLVDFPQLGTTTRKKRPALVVLDIGDADVVLAPITTRRRVGRGDYELCDWAASGLLRTSWVRLAKIACLDKRDISRRLGQVTVHDKQGLRQLWHTVYAL